MARGRRSVVIEEWERMEDAERMVKEVVAAYHPHLKGVEILCVGRPKATQRGGKLTLAKARRIRKVEQVFLEQAGIHARFLIEIAVDMWKIAEWKGKEALIDHELSHFGEREDGGVRMRAHDVEEFTEVLRRRGAWKPDLRKFVEVGKQLELPVAVSA